MLASPAHDSAAATGDETGSVNLVQPVITDLVMVSTEKIFQRVSAIAETLDALEAELHGGAAASNQLDALLDRLHGALPIHAEPASHRVLGDDSLQAVRCGLEDLLRLIQGGPSSDPEIDLDDVLRQIAPRGSSRGGSNHADIDSEIERLDEVLAQIQPLEEQVDVAIQDHTGITAQMTRELSRLVAFSQSLGSRAEQLDSQSNELTLQWDQLHAEREELSAQRERISHERFELSLRREALDAETQDLQLAYEGLAVQMHQANRPSAIEDAPPRLVSEYVWCEDNGTVMVPYSGSRNFETETTPGQDNATFTETSQSSPAVASADSLDEVQLQLQRQKLRVFVEAFDVDDDQEAVAVGYGQTMVLGHNSIENGLRSRDEAIRQLDELLLSYASVDAPSSSSPASSTGTSDVEALQEATFDFDSGDSLFDSHHREDELDEPLKDASVTEGNEIDGPVTLEKSVDLAQQAETQPDAVAETPDLFDDELEAAISRLPHAGLTTPIAAESVTASHREFAQPVITEPKAEEFFQVDEVGGSSIPLFTRTSEELPTASKPKSPDSEEGQLTNLRSQLAEMFGLDSIKPSDMDEPEAKPLEERFQSFYSGGRPVEEADLSTATEIPSIDDDIPVGSLLREVTKSESKSTSSKPAQEDDPIKAYMDQLIARNRRQTNQTESAAPIKPVAVASPPIEELEPLTSVPTASPTEDDSTWLSQDPAHKQDKEAARAHLKTLRQLANSSARTAVVRASNRQLKLQVLTKTVAAVMSLIFGVSAIVLELPEIYGYSVIGLGLIFAIDLVIVIVRNRSKISKQARLQRVSESEQSPKADPHTESRLANFARAESAT